MNKQRTDPPDSKPGDVIGREFPSGEWRVDRKIPLPWLVGIVAAGVVNAASMYYGLQQVIASMMDLKAEVRTLTQVATDGRLADREHTLQIADHERRLNALEARK